MRLQDQIALITGAGGGIGRALAIALAGRGMHLALADIDPAGLAETARLAGKPGLRLTTHHLDVADRAAVAALPAAIRDHHGGLDLLVNNAGVATGGTFEQVSEQDFDWLMSINFFGVVTMTRAFLPLLRHSGAARIVNISSIFGIIATPGQTAYTASKFAVRGFSESLRHELAGSTVGVTTVHPGGVATAIAANARVPAGTSPEEAARNKKRFAAALKLPPERAAAVIAAGIEKDRARIIVGNDAKIAAASERLSPVGYWSILKRLTGRRDAGAESGAGRTTGAEA